MPTAAHFIYIPGVLLLGVRRRAGILERAALHHHVVLHVLNDQRRAVAVDVDALVLAHGLLSS